MITMSWSTLIRIPEPEANQMMDLLESALRMMDHAERWLERIEKKGCVTYEIDFALDNIRYARADVAKVKEMLEVNAELSKKGGERQ